MSEEKVKTTQKVAETIGKASDAIQDMGTYFHNVSGEAWRQAGGITVDCALLLCKFHDYCRQGEGNTGCVGDRSC